MSSVFQGNPRLTPTHPTPAATGAGRRRGELGEIIIVELEGWKKLEGNQNEEKRHH